MAAAEAVGIGWCPISLIRDRIDAVAAVLSLPPGVCPVAGFCFGRLARPGFISMRLPPGVVVHRERYDDLSSRRRFYRSAGITPRLSRLAAGRTQIRRRISLASTAPTSNPGLQA
jgi:hypothetical protein